MAKAKAAPKRAAPVAPRVPLWRRLNRHHVFALHVILFIVGSIVIWSLPASQPDQQFDSLAWLALLCAHGLFVYRRRRVAFVFHLLMYSAGNAALWNTFATMPVKLALTAGWTVVIAIIGLGLYRSLVKRHDRPEPTIQRAAPARKPMPPPEPEPEPVYDDETGEDGYEQGYEESPDEAEPITYEPVDDADAYRDDESYIQYDEPTIDPDDTPLPQSKSKRKPKRG